MIPRRTLPLSKSGRGPCLTQRLARGHHLTEVGSIHTQPSIHRTPSWCSTPGLRREELVTVNLEQLSPRTPDDLHIAKKAKISDARGKGRTSRHVFLSADARAAVADYLEHERPADASAESTALFLSAVSIGSRRLNGRLSARSINTICEQIGRWHDAEHPDPARHISPLRPHDLRHTFAFALAAVTGNDAYELQRRLGHQSQRYINRYPNPPEDIAASYIEQM
jgi:integrase